MRFTPVPSTSPRVIARDAIDTLSLEVVHDPVNNARYLSVGIGEKSVRRVWLTAEQTVKLITILVKLKREME